MFAWLFPSSEAFHHSAANTFTTEKSRTTSHVWLRFFVSIMSFENLTIQKWNPRRLGEWADLFALGNCIWWRCLASPLCINNIIAIQSNQWAITIDSCLHLQNGPRHDQQLFWAVQWAQTPWNILECKDNCHHFWWIIEKGLKPTSTLPTSKSQAATRFLGGHRCNISRKPFQSVGFMHKLDRWSRTLKWLQFD
jgi:hypothetical protein